MIASFGIAVFFAILFGGLAFGPAMAAPAEKELVCHTDPDNDGAGLQTISVKNNKSILKHLEHGDHLGACFVCGDGFVDPPIEQCDDGNTDNGDGCSAICEIEPLCDDTDGDGVCDNVDICPGGNDTLDFDGDGIPDDCDMCPIDSTNDSDGDGVCDSVDMCPNFPDEVDSDGDGIPDDCDMCPGGNDTSDFDGDGIPDDCDMCPFDDTNMCEE